VPVSFLMGGVDIGRRRAANVVGPDWYQSGPGVVIDFCTSPVRTGNSTYPHALTSLQARGLAESGKREEGGRERWREGGRKEGTVIIVIMI